MRQAPEAGIFNVAEPPPATASIRELEGVLREGDIVFTRIQGTPFRQLADVTHTWTNHVGVVVGFNELGAVLAESRIPSSCRTGRLRKVCARRSAQGRVAVLRLQQPLSQEAIQRLGRAAKSRLGENL